VNQWHLPGIEYYWRHTTGTEEPLPFINPVGDMDLNLLAENDEKNEMQRRLHSLNSRSEPSIGANYHTHYHKTIVESERERHAIFDSAEDAHMEHALYNNENKEVKYKKYSDHH
jgi:hypothetical protein